MHDSTAPYSVPLMSTRIVNDAGLLAVTTGAWYPQGEWGGPCYESMIHTDIPGLRRQLIYHKRGGATTFWAHVNIVRSLMRWLTERQIPNCEEFIKCN